MIAVIKHDSRLVLLKICKQPVNVMTALGACLCKCYINKPNIGNHRYYGKAKLEVVMMLCVNQEMKSFFRFSRSNTSR